MTALATTPRFGFTQGLTSPSAGPVAIRVAQLTVAALEGLKGTPASSSLVFDDLQALAAEHGIDARTNETFRLAQLFLLALPSHLEAPNLNLDGDEEVLFDWRGSSGEQLTVALRRDGRLSYAARISAWDKDYGTKRFVDEIPQVVLDRVQQVTRG